MLSPNVKRALPYLACFALGFGTSEAIRSDPEPVTVERVVEKVTEGKKEVQTVYRVVTRTVKPDGTVTERTEDKAQTAKQETKKAKAEVAKSSTPAPAKARYALGLEYLPSLSAAPSMKDVRLEAAARLGGSGLWCTVGYDVKYKQASVGVRYEW